MRRLACLVVLFVVVFTGMSVKQIFAGCNPATDLSCGSSGNPACDVDEIISQLGQPQFSLAHLTDSAPALSDTAINAQYLFTLEPSTRQAVIKGFFPHIPSDELSPFYLLARLPSLGFSSGVYFYAFGANQASASAFIPATKARTHFEFRLPIEYFAHGSNNYVFPGPLEIYLNCVGHQTPNHVVDWPVAFYFPVYQRFHRVQRAGYFALASNGLLN